MNLAAFTIEYKYGGATEFAVVRPCCKNNIIDYRVWSEHELAFTVLQVKDSGRWIVSLKNTDSHIDEDMIQLIGAEIEKFMKLRK